METEVLRAPAQCWVVNPMTIVEESSPAGNQERAGVDASMLTHRPG
jgi:hypothetical protein